MNKKIIDTIFTNISIGVEKGIGHLYTQDAVYQGTKIHVNGTDLINFGTYSYLGLEQDVRLKEAAKGAIEKFGIQFGSSRTYMSTTLYAQLEEFMDELFEAHTVLVPTTTLGHMAVMPIIVQEGDMIIFDQNVHTSVQFMIHHLELQGVKNVMVRHNDLKALELEIVKNTPLYGKIWYMADSVYSMYGDVAPLEEINSLLEKHKHLHLYIDDAHGMSWAGKKGAGYALSKIKLTHKTIIASSLNKAFAAGGAAFVFKDKSLKTRVKTCGGPLIFSGQHLNAALGASIACAKIHLSPEIYKMQEKLQNNIALCREELQKRNLPDMSNSNTPIFFIGVGLPKVGYNLIKRLQRAGFHTNLAMFPAVNTNKTGVRFSITTNHTKKEIIDLIDAIDYHLYEALKEEGRSVDDIKKNFRNIKDFKPDEEKFKTTPFTSCPSTLYIKSFSSISEIPKPDINIIFKKYFLSPRILEDLEEAFSRNALKEDNWQFTYLIAYKHELPQFFTFFTSTLIKEDIIASKIQSKLIEEKRKTEPYYLCSYALIMGTPITFGNHIWKSKGAEISEIQEEKILDYIQELFESSNANSIVLRDMGALGFKQSTLQGMGYIESEGLSFFEVDQLNGSHFFNSLKTSHRYFVRKRAISKEGLFTTVYDKNMPTEELKRVFQLYLDTQKRSFDLNTFPYNFSIFEKANRTENPDWDILRLYSKKSKKLVGIAISIMNANAYNFLIAGLAYPDNSELDTYSQLLFQLIKRAEIKQCNYINLGYTTKQNKMKFGAEEKKSSSYSKFKDTFKQNNILHELQKHR
ncbi:MAG: aminotransferase class I/II-fold pyridoxal phosphate-dependent enzyme [Flavobacteriaceae bacterium]